MRALICGSIAYDHIMIFSDRFKNYILPDKVHMLNVSFLVPQMRKEYGGCAGNIAYGLTLLQQELALPMATVGKDFSTYAEWMDLHQVDRNHIRILDDAFTAQAFITTDMDDNQITAFHPGAMNESHRNRVSDANDCRLGIISPDGRDGMLQHAQQFVDADIPFVFDPGQGIPMFNGEELTAFIEKASWVTVNDYEWQLMQDRTGLDERQVSEIAEALIVTRGGQGSIIYTNNQTYTIPLAKPTTINDPTGCGDAYRAGLIYGLMHDMDWETTGRIASLMGAIKIEQHGTQNHQFTLASFKQRFKSEFSYEF